MDTPQLCAGCSLCYAVGGMIFANPVVCHTPFCQVYFYSSALTLGIGTVVMLLKLCTSSRDQHLVATSNRANGALDEPLLDPSPACSV